MEKMQEGISSENENSCKECGDEVIFMDGLCEACYEESFYENNSFESRKKAPDMKVSGRAMQDPHQQEISRKRTISKISRKKK
mgnify:CR=1 FL=1|jgi:hypothetical protein